MYRSPRSLKTRPLWRMTGYSEETFEIRREQQAIPWLDWVVGEIEICHQQRQTLLVSLSK